MHPPSWHHWEQRKFRWLLTPIRPVLPPLHRLSPLRRRQGRRQRGQEAASWTACKSTHRSQEDVVPTTFYLEFHPAGQARKHEMVKRHLLAPLIATQAIDSYIRGILQLSTWCVLSHVQLFMTSWIIACQAPLSMGLSRQECWSRLHFLLQGIFLTQGSNPCPTSLTLAHGIFTTGTTWEAHSTQYLSFSVQTHLWESFLSFLSPSWNSSEVNLLWWGCKKFRTVLALLHHVLAYK